MLASTIWAAPASAPGSAAAAATSTGCTSPALSFRSTARANREGAAACLMTGAVVGSGVVCAASTTAAATGGAAGTGAACATCLAAGSGTVIADAASSFTEKPASAPTS